MGKILRPRLVILFIIFCAVIFLTNIWIKKEIDVTITPAQKNLEQDTQTVAVKREAEKSQPQRFSSNQNTLPPIKNFKKQAGTEDNNRSTNQSVIHELMIGGPIIIQ